jgi:hypothetical protein
MAIAKLREEIEHLKKQLKQSQYLTDSLIELWDNEYDDRWNNC